MNSKLDAVTKDMQRFELERQHAMPLAISTIVRKKKVRFKCSNLDDESHSKTMLHLSFAKNDDHNDIIIHSKEICHRNDILTMFYINEKKLFQLAFSPFNSFKQNNNLFAK